MSSEASLTSWGEGTPLALVGNHFSDGVTIRRPCEPDVLHRPVSHPIFSFWVGYSKTESGFVGSNETGSGRQTLVVAVISVDAYPFWLSQN